MRHPARILLLVLGVLAFLAISLGLARVLSVNGSEQSAILDLLRAQARGDVDAMIEQIEGCAQRPSCVADARRTAARLQASGKVVLVRLDASTSFSPFGHDGVARVVWKTPTRTTIVQCVDVHRGGDVFSGLTVDLRALSRPIGHQAACPSAS